jgi:hypothetical protein
MYVYSNYEYRGIYRIQVSRIQRLDDSSLRMSTASPSQIGVAIVRHGQTLRDTETKIDP